MSEQPALIYFSSTQPSDESRDDESNHSDSGTVLGAHHRRMMQSFSKPDPEPASPLASASTQDRTPPRTGPTRRGGPGPGLGGANGTVDGTIDDGTVDGTIDQTTLSASDAASPSPLGPPAEIRSAAAGGSLAPVTEPGEETTVPRSGAEEHALRRLLRRLDTFERQDLLLGKYQVLGRQQQRLGGTLPALKLWLVAAGLAAALCGGSCHPSRPFGRSVLRTLPNAATDVSAKTPSAESDRRR